MTHEELEGMRTRLRKIRAAQVKWTAAKAAYDAAQADIKRLGLSACTYGQASAHLIIPSEKALREAAEELRATQTSAVEAMMQQPALFNVLWSVFGLAREG